MRISGKMDPTDAALEIRNPKSEVRRKSENPNPNNEVHRLSGWWICRSAAFSDGWAARSGDEGAETEIRGAAPLLPPK
jgi:hypothetical protein